MAMGLNFFFGPITSALCDRFGCRVVSFAGAFFSVLGLLLTSFVQEVSKMYVTYGVVWGVGSSLSFVSSIVVLGQYFKKRLALANGIATSGSGVGSLVASPVINFLLQTVGWKSSMRILSGFAGILWMAALLFKPREIDDADRKEHTKLFDTSVWKNKAYVLWVTTVALFQFGYLVPFVHLVSYIWWPSTVFKYLCLIHHYFLHIYDWTPVFCKSQGFIVEFWLRLVLLLWQLGWLKTRLKKWFLLIFKNPAVYKTCFDRNFCHLQLMNGIKC